MLKNENGYPIEKASVACTGDRNMQGSPSPEDQMLLQKDMNGCGGRGDCIDNFPLAYLYAPDQRFRLLYSAKDALAHGTLFEELYKPMEVYGNE